MTTVQELKIQLLPRLRRAFKAAGCEAIVQHQFSVRYQPDDLFVHRGPDHAFVEIVKEVRATDVKRLTRLRTHTFARGPTSWNGSRAAWKRNLGTPGGMVFVALVEPKVDPNMWSGGTAVHWETYDGTDLDVLALRIMERVIPLLDERMRARESEPAPRRVAGTAAQTPGAGGTRAGGTLESSGARAPSRPGSEDPLAFDAMASIARALLHDSGRSVEYELNLAEDELRHGHDVATRLHLARTVEALLLGLVREWDASGGVGIFERVQSLQNQLHEIQIELARLSLLPDREPPSGAQMQLPARGRKLIEGLFELYRNSGERDPSKEPRNPPSIEAAYHAIRRQLSRLSACRDIFKELDAEGVIQKIVDDRNAIAHVRIVATPGDDHRRANRMLALSRKLFDAMARLDAARKAALPLIG